MTEPVGTAQYFPWNGGAIFVGTAGAFPAHAHQAIQICFLFEGRIRLRASDADEWRGYDVAIVPSRHSHGMDGSRNRYGATLFVEPETREGRVLTERYLREGIANVDRAPVEPVAREIFDPADPARPPDVPHRVPRERDIAEFLERGTPRLVGGLPPLDALFDVEGHVAANLGVEIVVTRSHGYSSRPAAGFKTRPIA